MVSKVRAQRISDRIHEELSSILRMEVSDPRVTSAYITKVRVDNELSYANVYVSSLEGSQEADTILEGLKHASGFLRNELAQRVQYATFPVCAFIGIPVQNMPTASSN